MKEWLPMLNIQSKWVDSCRDLKVVILYSPSTRGHWPLGRITEVFPGKDSHVRVAMQIGVLDINRTNFASLTTARGPRRGEFSEEIHSTI